MCRLTLQCTDVLNACCKSHINKNVVAASPTLITLIYECTCVSARVQLSTASANLYSWPWKKEQHYLHTFIRADWFCVFNNFFFVLLFKMEAEINALWRIFHILNSPIILFMSQYNNHWRLTNHKVACWCIMQIFKCGICVLADGCISKSYLNILVSLHVFLWICRHTHPSRPGVVLNFAAVFIVMSSIHFLSRWQCLFRDFTCVRLVLYWLQHLPTWSHGIYVPGCTI